MQGSDGSAAIIIGSCILLIMYSWTLGRSFPPQSGSNQQYCESRTFSLPTCSAVL